MSTKPKAKKFRVRRSVILADGGENPELKAQSEAAKSKLQDSAGGGGQKPTPTPVTQLTARQLRMAGRLAERKGLKVANNEEAVNALRARGIDPFSAKRLEIVPGKPGPAEKSPVPVPGGGPVPGGVQLPAHTTPAPVPAKTDPAGMPTPADLADDKRAAQLIKMQRDIARRRRRNYATLIGRLAMFVVAPTIAAWYYFAFVASPMYSTHSDFIIQQSESAAASSMGGLLSGTSLANSQDSITVQSYLTSRGAMLRLEEDIGFSSHYSAQSIDALQRLDPEASNEGIYGQYKKSVKIGYDPTEGMVRMEVVAPDPQLGMDISLALLNYAEEEVDSLNRPIRRDQMAGAEQSLIDAEENMRSAQNRVLDLQQARGVLSAEAEVSSLMGQISTFEIQLKEQRLRLQTLMDNSQPNQTKVSVTERDIARLEAMIGEMRAQMTEGGSGTASLARITGELVIAEAELQTRQAMLSQSLQQLETARIEANRQVRYLLQGVRPTLTDEPSYPKVFENTLLAFLIFAGIYLMVSLTLSVLREQVSS